MSNVTVAIPYHPGAAFEAVAAGFAASPLVKDIVVLHDGSFSAPLPKCRALEAASPGSGHAIKNLLAHANTEFLLLVTQTQPLTLGQYALDRFVAVARETGAGMVYADYHEVKGGVRLEHPLIDYQFGSIRDNFDFGALQL